MRDILVLIFICMLCYLNTVKNTPVSLHASKTAYMLFVLVFQKIPWIMFWCLVTWLPRRGQTMYNGFSQECVWYGLMFSVIIFGDLLMIICVVIFFAYICYQYLSLYISIYVDIYIYIYIYLHVYSLFI